MKRDEENPTQQITYANRLPDDLSGRQCFLIDPMLATGGTLVAATHYLAERGAKDVTAVCILGAPEGLKFVEENLDPSIKFKLVLCAVDEKLNDKCYIVPGLGDARRPSIWRDRLTASELNRINPISQSSKSNKNGLPQRKSCGGRPKSYVKPLLLVGDERLENMMVEPVIALCELVAAAHRPRHGNGTHETSQPYLRTVAAMPIVGDEIRAGNPVENQRTGRIFLGERGRIRRLLLPLRPPGKLATAHFRTVLLIPVDGCRIERFDHIRAGIGLQQRVALFHELDIARTPLGIGRRTCIRRSAAHDPPLP